MTYIDDEVDDYPFDDKSSDERVLEYDSDLGIEPGENIFIGDDENIRGPHKN